MSYKTAAAKKEEQEALKNSAESIKQLIEQHKRWLGYNTPLSEGGNRLSTHELPWLEWQKEKYPMLAEHFDGLIESKKFQIEFVKQAIEKLESRLGLENLTSGSHAL